MKKVLHVSNTEFDLSATNKAAAMKELPTAENVILKTLLLQSHLEKVGCYDEVIEAMRTYAKAVADELAGRIKENENSVEFDLWLDSIVEKLKSELS